MSFFHMVPLVALLGLVLFENTWGLTPFKFQRQTLALRCRPFTLFAESTAESIEKNSGANNVQQQQLPENLVSALDLAPLLQHVAAHAGMRRTRQAFLSLVHLHGEDHQDVPLGNSLPSFARRRRATGLGFSTSQMKRKRRQLCIPTATSASGARRTYELVEQASLALEQNDYNLTFPPLYESDPFDTRSIALTDDDDWIEFSSSDDWTLEHIAQAEQVVGTILRVYEWSRSDAVQTWARLLADIGTSIDVDELREVEKEIKGSIKICQVRSISDPTGRNTYSFTLDESKYIALGIIREKGRELHSQSITNPMLERQLVAIEEELTAKELEIKLGLVHAVSSKLNSIDQGLHVMAQLDLVFAKAAFGLRLSARIPRVANEMKIDVAGFIHPLLTLGHEAIAGGALPVPIDLKLSGNKRALIITGPNGGGKTLAMKGFGLAVMLCKLGIPIPVVACVEKRRIAVPRPRVDFFDHVLVSIGDGQDLIQGESTFTAQMSSIASTISRVRGNYTSARYLLLLDELGSGTEANAGGAIAQAVVENLCAHESCRLIATTHSTRLKALAHESDKFECAGVLLKPSESRWQLPSFHLQYGVIGESYAFGAASRSHPPLPEDVVTRAQDLMKEDAPEDGKSSYNHALSLSLQNQIDLANTARNVAEKHEYETAMIQRAMVHLAAAYEWNLSRLENRVEGCYQKLRADDGNDSLDIVGETLGELRVVLKQVKSEQDMLRDRGLLLLPDDYQIRTGESLVVVEEGEWEGTTVVVVSVDASEQNIAVIPSLSLVPSSHIDESTQKTVMLKRYQLAMWDFDSVWRDNTGSDDNAFSSHSTAECKRRLNKVLASIKKEKVVKATKSVHNGVFRSSRERKASKKAKQKEKKGRMARVSESTAKKQR